MKTLPYTLIKTEQQYQAYCQELETLLTEAPTAAAQDEIDLLTLLIETWDEAQSRLPTADPVELLTSLMAEHQLLAKDLAGILEVGKGTVSDILNRRRGMSKTVIRRSASYFHVSQEAFNRPYELAVTAARLPRNAKVVHQQQPQEAAVA